MNQKATGKELESVDASTVVGYSPDGFEFETVHAEAPDQIQFEIIGDTYIGRYIGHEIIWPDPEKKPGEWFAQLQFVDPTGAKVINAGYDLQRAFVAVTYDGDGRPDTKDKIPAQSIVRITYMKDVDVDQQSAMRSYRVDTARPASADNSGS